MAPVDLESLHADNDGVRARLPVAKPLDVTFDGRRVWSTIVNPDDVGAEGMALLTWPEPLRKYLDGRATVDVRDHDTGEVLARADIRMGSGEHPIDLTDSRGRALAMHKWGKLGQAFDDLPADAREVYLDQVMSVLRVLNGQCDVEAFISFGTLLGAVRDGRLIGHDVDVDLGYYSEHSSPVDVIRQSFAVERALRERTGWRTSRANGGFIQLFPPQPDGTTRNIDVFSCFTTDAGRLYQVNDIVTVGTRADVVPVQDIELEGRLFPAPARPEIFLEAAYGPSWRVPDPTFRYKASLSRRRVRMWMGGLREDKDRWSRFYNAHRQEIPRGPSSFARWVNQQSAADLVVDVGCGTGRDTLFYARRGRTAVGLDVVPGAYRAGQRKAARTGLSASFRPINLSSLRDTLRTGADLAAAQATTDVVARFLVHNLTPDDRDNFWRLCSMLLDDGGRAYLEFRVPRDRRLPKHWPSRGRRYLSPKAAVDEAARHGAVEVSRVVGRGLAPFKDEDPWVCRLVLEWSGTPTPGVPHLKESRMRTPGRRSRKNNDLEQRLLSLEDKVQHLLDTADEDRRMHRRLAELADVVQQQLLPDSDTKQPPSGVVK